LNQRVNIIAVNVGRAILNYTQRGLMDMRTETPVFLIFENKMSKEAIEKMKRRGCVPVAIDGDNIIFRLQAKYEYVET
jgi:hypothetical protein